MYWCKPRRLALIMLAAALAAFMQGCKPDVVETGSQMKYFNLKGYFYADSAKLAKQNPVVTKTVTHNGKIETKKLHIANWGAELGLFIGSDINKPAWKDSYTASTTGDALIYRSIDSTLKTSEVIIDKPKGKIKWIMIINHTKNILYETKEKLIYYPDSLYIIEKLQIVRLLGRNRYDIKGQIK